MYSDFPYKLASDYGVTLSPVQNPLALRAGACRLYERMRRKSLLSRIRSWLGRRGCSLRSLEGIVAGDGYDAGTQTVPIEAIVGSEGRCADFDREFRPMQGHTAERWIGVAIARLNGDALPLVELLKVGEEYYVRDGHHRVSVARALGECYVDARVTVCG